MLVAIHVQYMNIYNLGACDIRLLKTFLFFCINTPQKLIQVWNTAQIEVRECLLLFGAESFVLQVAIQKFKD